MQRACCLVVLCASTAVAEDPAWTVLERLFSAVSIGIGFTDDSTGWTSHTDGSSLPQIVRTTDGGKTWKNVTSTTGVPLSIVTGVAAARSATQGSSRDAEPFEDAVKDAAFTAVATAGVLESEKWSLDGLHFSQSLGAPLTAQDVKFQAGRAVLAGPSGPCLSSTAGALYACKRVPLKYNQTGRYASAPSKDVIYFTAGQWPRDGDGAGPVPHGDGTSHVHVTRNLRVHYGQSGRVQRVEVGAQRSSFGRHTGKKSPGYTAELWKSTDGGETWRNLITDEGAFYFNDIHCIDETHCVAVGEGFAEDNSTSPGARVYTTSDGETFKLAHTESAKGTESLLAARMLSATEHWAGGTTKAGGLLAPALLLHSKDAGKTYANENHGLVGLMVTALDFLSPEHAYATAVNAAQLCSILEYAAPAPLSPLARPGEAPALADVVV